MAGLSLQTVLKLVQQARKLLPIELISENSYARLLALAPHMPDSIILGLECRLQEREEPVDLWICPGIEPKVLQKSASWLREQNWREFAPLADCLERLSPPWPCSAGAWTTEFDLASWDIKSDHPPIPSSFVTFGTVKPRLSIVDTVSALWRGERGIPIDNGTLDQLKRVLKKCPTGELAGWGFLYPRPNKPARLMLRVNDIKELSGLLEDHMLIAENLLNGLTYQLVIGTPLYYAQEKRQSIEAYIKSPEAWKELSKRLVVQGYCSPSKAIAMVKIAVNPPRQNGYLATLNHIKMAITENGRVEVKVYPSIFSCP